MAPTTLSFNCNPAHGVVPWTATVTGKLSDSSGIGIPNASIPIQYLDSDGVTWFPTGITAITDASGNYSTEFPFTVENGWTAGSTGVIRAAFSGDGVNDASASNSVTVTMDGGGGNTTLTFACNPTIGTVPWTTVVTGRLTDALGNGVANATIAIEFQSGASWYPSGVFVPPTDNFGNYTTSFEFNIANGWTPGSTGILRATFMGDGVNNASNSNSVTVTMNPSGTDGYLKVDASQKGVAVSASVTAGGQSGTTPVTFTLSPATYTVNATYQGATLTQTAVVSAGQTNSILFNFEGGGFNLLLPATLAFGLVSVALIATRKGGKGKGKKRGKKKGRRRR